MREIKFRGMDLNGTWHYGFLSNVTDSRICGEVGWFISNSKGSPFAYLIRPETRGQYTGLKDKNGVEIYEGDIVRTTDIHKVVYAGDKERKEERIMIVQYDVANPCFVLVDAKNRNRVEYDFIVAGLRSHEIIGNIYENPELLEDTTGRNE